jgi:hypothetical protein
VPGIDELLANSRRFVERFPVGHLDARPSRRLAIVACTDSRLNVFGALGLEPGQAHIIRNAGGIVSDEVIRSLAISPRRLGMSRPTSASRWSGSRRGGGVRRERISLWTSGSGRRHDAVAAPFHACDRAGGAART